MSFIHLLCHYCTYGAITALIVPLLHGVCHYCIVPLMHCAIDAHTMPFMHCAIDALKGKEENIMFPIK